MSITRGSGLIHNRDFRLWYLSRSISVAGTAASAVALPLLVYQTSESPALTAAVVGVQAVPYLLFGLLAGAAADRLRRKAMMVGADVACGLLLATLPVAQLIGTVGSWHVLAVAFGVGCGFCWFDAAAWGARARLVSRSRIAQANSVIWSTEVVVELAAPAAAGLLAAATDPTLVVTLDAVSYLISAVLIAQVRGALDPEHQAAGRQRIWAGIGEGLAYLWRQPVIRALSLTGFGFNVACGGVIGLLVVHADQMLAVGPTDQRIGLLYTAGAAGSLVASLVLPAFSRRAGQGHVSIIGFAVLAAATIGLAVTHMFAAALVLWVVWAAARLTVNGNGITVRQLLTPDELQGRVNTTGRMIAWGGTPFGALIGGTIAQSTGAGKAYLVLALPAVVGLVLLLATPVRGLRIDTAQES